MEMDTNKSLLIAVRDKESCSQGVRFVSSFFDHPREFLVTLFYVTAKAILGQSILDSWGDNKNVHILPPEIEETFVLCSTILQQKGFLASQIQKIARNKRIGTVQDIMEESKEGLYDALILGKKSTSFLENIFYGNKGYEILEKELSCPIWFCRNPDETRKNVLLCLDGSSLGERVADHVGFILEKQTRHSVTLLHVEKKQALDIDKVFQGATAILNGYGVTDERIHRSLIKSSSVTRTILEITEDNKFAALALGSVGQTAERGLGEWLVGSKCRNIFDKIDKSTLWIVP